MLRRWCGRAGALATRRVAKMRALRRSLTVEKGPTPRPGEKCNLTNVSRARLIRLNRNSLGSNMTLSSGPAVESSRVMIPWRGQIALPDRPNSSLWFLDARQNPEAFLTTTSLRLYLQLSALGGVRGGGRTRPCASMRSPAPVVSKSAFVLERTVRSRGHRCLHLRFRRLPGRGLTGGR
jgi:hypothetical protein